MPASLRLKNIPLFHDLDESQLKTLSERTERKKYNKGKIILFEQDLGSSLFIIVSGKVKISILSDKGKEIILAEIGEGAFFGEMALLDGLPRSANVTALEDTEVLVLKREDFLTHLKNNPEVGIKLLSVLTQRLRHADRQIESLALMDVYGRIARVILQLAEENGKAVEEGILIENRPTQQEMANMAATSRETVSRVLKDLSNHGFIKMTRKNIVIMDVANLINQNFFK